MSYFLTVNWDRTRQIWNWEGRTGESLIYLCWVAQSCSSQQIPCYKDFRWQANKTSLFPCSQDIRHDNFIDFSVLNLLYLCLYNCSVCSVTWWNLSGFLTQLPGTILKLILNCFWRQLPWELHVMFCYFHLIFYFLRFIKLDLYFSLHCICTFLCKSPSRDRSRKFLC